MIKINQSIRDDQKKLPDFILFTERENKKKRRKKNRISSFAFLFYFSNKAWFNLNAYILNTNIISM